ncbi:hypothetical protein [Streptomyces sp. NPDC048106]|uniref:hypothetical protein n=1 Tax=Streptomyces sp. NPDC048106 TaxID=3155750 RepID=UPI0034555EF4
MRGQNGPDLFSGSHPEDDLQAQLPPFIAPVAASRGAVVEDATSLRIAEAIHDAFGDLSSERGLTRSELEAACSAVAGPEAFEQRFGVFVALRLLERVREKAHEGRYVFNPTSGAALLVFERLAEAGGVEDIMSLLDRTQRDVAEGVLDEKELVRKLRRVRRDLRITTDYLLRRVRSRPIEELLGQRHHHRAKAALMVNARRLVEMVSRDFPGLRADGTHLIREALRYSAAVDEFYDRLLAQASTRRDFSMLPAEQYRTAALTSSVAALAGVFSEVVFDPPAMQVSPAGILEAAEKHRPPAPRRRAAPPPEPAPGPDPVETARARAAALREQRLAAMELLIGGRDEADLTQALRGRSWRAAVTMLARVLRASADPSVPFMVEVSGGLAIDPAGPVTYASPVSLFRVPQDTSAVDEVSQTLPEDADER